MPAARRLSERLFVRALRLLPRGFAVEYGADMVRTFARRAEDVRSRGGSVLLLFTLREIAGVIAIAVTERGQRLRANAARSAAHMDLFSRLDHMLTEIRHAARRLVRTPGFTCAAVLTLALAIGANTAIFTLLNRIVLSPLPYADADRLMWVDHTAPGVGLMTGIGMSKGLYHEYRTLPSTESIALHTMSETTLSGEGAAARMSSLIATPSLADVLAVEPALGRWFSADEGTPDGPPVAVLTYSMWMDRFGGSPSVIGRSLRLDGEVHEVIGVMPRGFAYPDTRPQMILPLRLVDSGRFEGFNLQAIARLRPGVTIEQARREHAAVIADLPARFPADLGLMESLITDVGLAPASIPLKEQMLGTTGRMLWVLLGAVSLVLLIACANVANLFLVRTDARQREVAVRRALGAGTANVSAYFLAETILVAIASGVIGLLLGYVAVQLLVLNGPVELPRMHEVHVDLDVVAFTALASLAAGLVFGFMPLIRRLPPLSAVLRDASRGNTAGSTRMHARQMLMASQVALAVVLLVGAGLMVKSVQRMWAVDPGFDAESRLVFSIGLPYSEYGANAEAVAFHDLLLERLRSLPGVQTAAFSSRLPLDGDGDGDPLDVRGRVLGFEDLGPIVRYRRVSADYFTAMDIPLLKGRYLDAHDADGSTNVAVINQQVADLYFPDEDPLGRQVRKMAGNLEGEWMTIVGIVGNTPTLSLQENEPAAKMYFPPLSKGAARVTSAHSASYVLHTSRSPASLVPEVRRTLTELNPNIALARAEPLTHLVQRAGARLAFTMALLVIAAAAAVLLGIIGVYAVISYAVAQRTGEIGLRLALGAQSNDVTRMIVRQSGTVIAGGVIAGIAAAAGGARLLQALLFGVQWNDLATYAAASAGLFVVAIIACWLPAQRAARSASSLQSLMR